MGSEVICQNCGHAAQYHKDDGGAAVSESWCEVGDCHGYRFNPKVQTASDELIEKARAYATTYDLTHHEWIETMADFAALHASEVLRRVRTAIEDERLVEPQTDGDEAYDAAIHDCLRAVARLETEAGGKEKD